MFSLIKKLISLFTPGSGKNSVVLTALDVDVTNKDLHYYSMEKVAGFGLGSYRNGYGGGGSVAGVGVSGSKAAVPKSDRELLTDVGRYLQNHDQLVYEKPSTAVPGSSYLLARVLGEYGSLWTFVTPDDSPIRDVIWFKGEGVGVRVLAYGSRQNLAREGGIPEKSEYVASWWPSSYETHRAVVDHLVDCATKNSCQSVNDSEELKYDVDSFVRGCFNDGVRKHSTCTYGLYEILLRVDRIDNYDDGTPWVVGSPIWFAKCSYGVYTIPSPAASDERYCDVYGTWDGGRWVNVFYGPNNKKKVHVVPSLKLLEGCMRKK